MPRCYSDGLGGEGHGKQIPKLSKTAGSQGSPPLRVEKEPQVWRIGWPPAPGLPRPGS